MLLLKTAADYLELNMKKIIDGIIVVEGINDVSYLSSLIDATFVSLNGLEINNLEFLKKAARNKHVYLLTDSDKEGERIRSKVKEAIPSVIDVIVDPKKCNRKGKHGVFECETAEIYRVFSKYFTDFTKTNNIEEYLKVSQKIGLAAQSKQLRKYICSRVGIEECNNKTFIKRIALLNIKVEEIEEMIKEFENGNR